MRITIVTPAPPRTRHGNRITALRWARLLGDLGHEVCVSESWEEGDGLLVALHARRSAASVERAASASPRSPIVLALTGTDVYPDLETAGVDDRILGLADRLVVLQPLALEQLPGAVRGRARVVLQSVEPRPAPAVATEAAALAPHAAGTESSAWGGPQPSASFEVAQLAHLRTVKDPLLLAEAVRDLPPSSGIRVIHMGAVLDPQLGDRARRESETNDRYWWLGELPRDEALGIVSRCRLLVLASRHEGGANAVSEAVVLKVPPLCSRIPGSVGLLGRDYPGYFEPGDASELRRLLLRCEDPASGLLAELRQRTAALRTLFVPERERDAWRGLLGELGVPSPTAT